MLFRLPIISTFRKIIMFFVAGFTLLSLFTTPKLATPQNPNKDTGNVFLPNYGDALISAHRIGKGNAPENTLKAIKSCLDSEYRIDTLEMDLQLTKDGKLVLFHDLYLDEKSDSVEIFGKKNVTVFSKTYEELRQLNMGEYYKNNGKTPYAGLRGEDVPDDIRIACVEDVLDYVESHAPGKYTYVMEIKYPHPWMPTMVDNLYKILSERNLCDKVIIGSFWNDTSHYIDNHYKGKLLRSANPAEIISFYGSYLSNEELDTDDVKFMALQIPYYWDDGKLILANLGKTEFIDYAHKYGISVQYWTVDNEEDAKHLTLAGADMLMTDHPEKVVKYVDEIKSQIDK